MVSAAILPLHDPVRIAEQIAVLDNAAPGRLWIVVGAGYRVEEFEMAGLEHAARGRILEEYVGVLLEAWKGEPFEWRGRTVTVTPKPATLPHPMVLVGGGVPAAARRAARLRLPMLPMNTDQVVRDAYAEEGKRVGYKGFVVETVGPDVRARGRRPRAGVGGDRPVRALRGADLRVVPDAGPALDAGREGRDGRRPPGVAAVRGGHARAGAGPAGTGST